MPHNNFIDFLFYRGYVGGKQSENTGYASSVDTGGVATEQPYLNARKQKQIVVTEEDKKKSEERFMKENEDRRIFQLGPW